MRYVIAWAVVIFVIILLNNRFDILHDIGASVRSGIEAVKDGYNGDPLQK